MFDYLNWYYIGLMVSFTVAGYILYLVSVSKDDPLYHCPRYRNYGCTHIDGMFCDLKTCTMKDDTNE